MRPLLSRFRFADQTRTGLMLFPRPTAIRMIGCPGTSVNVMPPKPPSSAILLTDVEKKTACALFWRELPSCAVIISAALPWGPNRWTTGYASLPSVGSPWPSGGAPPSWPSGRAPWIFGNGVPIQRDWFRPRRRLTARSSTFGWRCLPRTPRASSLGPCAVVKTGYWPRCLVATYVAFPPICTCGGCSE